MAGRVTVRVEHARNLFYQRMLKSWKASLPDGDHMHYVLYRANVSVAQYPLELTGIAELKKLKGIADHLAVRLDAGWDTLCSDLGKTPSHREIKALRNDAFAPIVERTKSAKSKEKEERRLKRDNKKKTATVDYEHSDDEFREPPEKTSRPASSTASSSSSVVPPKSSTAPMVAQRTTSSAPKKKQRTIADSKIADDEIVSIPSTSSSQNTNYAMPSSQTSTSSSTADDEVRYITVKPQDRAEVILICDNREVGRKNAKGPVEHLQSVPDIRLELRTLSVGDFLWVARLLDGEEMILDWVVERKTWQDLDQSIRQGRYDDQKKRLRHAPMQNRVYLIEGRGGGDQRCNQALATTLTHDHYLIQRCETPKETAHFLESVTRRLMHRVTTCTMSGVRFADLQRFAKKTNIETVKDSWVRQIMVCPGMSSSRALELGSRFPSLPSLVAFIRSRGNLQEALPRFPKTLCQQLIKFFDPQLG